MLLWTHQHEYSLYSHTHGAIIGNVCRLTETVSNGRRSKEQKATKKKKNNEINVDENSTIDVLAKERREGKNRHTHSHTQFNKYRCLLILGTFWAKSLGCHYRSFAFEYEIARPSPYLLLILLILLCCAMRAFNFNRWCFFLSPLTFAHDFTCTKFIESFHLFAVHSVCSPQRPYNFSFSIIFRMLLLYCSQFILMVVNIEQKNNTISRLLFFSSRFFPDAGCCRGDNKFPIFTTFDSVYLSIFENVFRDPPLFIIEISERKRIPNSNSSANARTAQRSYRQSACILNECNL